VFTILVQGRKLAPGLCEIVYRKTGKKAGDMHVPNGPQ
jgi:hypothetical protein